jgi:hypothetical protein
MHEPTLVKYQAEKQYYAVEWTLNEGETIDSYIFYAQSESDDDSGNNTITLSKDANFKEFSNIQVLQTGNTLKVLIDGGEPLSRFLIRNVITKNNGEKEEKRFWIQILN